MVDLPFSVKKQGYFVGSVEDLREASFAHFVLQPDLGYFVLFPVRLEAHCSGCSDVDYFEDLMRDQLVAPWRSGRDQSVYPAADPNLLRVLAESVWAPLAAFEKGGHLLEQSMQGSVADDWP